MSATLDVHIEQISTVNRLQRFSTDWAKTKQTEEYDLTSIDTIPISLVAVVDD